MMDKLTKKRIKVDYEKMIIYLKLDGDFVMYMFKNNNRLSIRRLALAFLRSKKINVDEVFFEMKEKGLHPEYRYNDLAEIELKPTYVVGEVPPDKQFIDNGDFFKDW